MRRCKVDIEPTFLGGQKKKLVVYCTDIDKFTFNLHLTSIQSLFSSCNVHTISKHYIFGVWLTVRELAHHAYYLYIRVAKRNKTSNDFK